jgi:acyl-CoA dehydrogenase
VESDFAGKGGVPRLYTIAPVSNNLVLAFIGQHVLGLPKSY